LLSGGFDTDGKTTHPTQPPKDIGFWIIFHSPACLLDYELKYTFSVNPPNIYYSAILMTAGVACLVVAVMIWYTRRGAIGATSLTILLLALSWWDITYAIFWIDLPGLTPYFWLDITLVGAFIVPTSLLLFSLEHAHLQKWLTRPIRFALFIEPILAFILLWTDPWHGLFYGGKRALNTTMILDAGMVHWANVYYSYALILISVVILSLVAHRSVGIYRRQTIMILAAMVIPWIVHIGFLSTGGLLPDADVTPFIFSITAVIFAFALVRYRLLDIVPIARTVLIESMSEGVIVLDTRNRVVDINPAASKVTKLSAPALIGEPVEKVFANWKDIVTRYQDVRQVRVEVQADQTHLDLRVSPLMDNRNQIVGRLIVWRDITELKRTQAKLERLATIDGLTEVLNRRSFMEKAHNELIRSLRFEKNLSLALMDIDHFKKINDTYGHPAGDRALMEFSRLCMVNIREVNVFARFGGEEFALLMPETDIDQAYQVCERMRLNVARSSMKLDGQTVSITISLGISSMDDKRDTIDKILHRADQALYSAKQSGRNQTVIWQTPVKE
jgi:diguanylate cyclase (GGDEF)-like protein/PAS domain S-box-containing protein